MPTYLYRCTPCEATQETWRSINSQGVPEIHCLNCDAIMTRVYAIPALVFSGTGWGRD
jgi:putative FmdB family regulatory protein